MQQIYAKYLQSVNSADLADRQSALLGTSAASGALTSQRPVLIVVLVRQLNTCC